jgi:hypothetical protein
VSDAIAQLLEQLDEAYQKKAWHGPNLRGALRGVDVEHALWRPAPQRHNIWEQALHCAYWKYIVHRRLTGTTRGSFPRPGSNWFECSTPDRAAWRADLRLLGQMHTALREAVAALPPSALKKAPPGAKPDNQS